MKHASSIRVFDAVKALAFVGDLSMGQPIDHSTRTAWIAARLAAAGGGDEAEQGDAASVALLRWSGCTANAPEISDLLGDDVGGRRAMLSAPSAGPAPAALAAHMGPLAEIHCEVSGEIAHTLGMSPNVERALRHIFEFLDGRGPQGLRDAQIPREVFLVSVAGDLEIFSRAHGLPGALRCLAERSGVRYPAELVDVAKAHAADWLHALDQGAAIDMRPASAELQQATAPLELVADVIDLKLPWMTGFSRRVAQAAVECAAAMGLDEVLQGQLHRAALIHGIGRASVANAVWESTGARSEADSERLRLVPYWTERAARRIEPLRVEAEIASFVDERLDGSGFFRGAKGPSIDVPARVLAAAAHWVWLRTNRPGQAALEPADAALQLRREGELGRLDAAAVAALTGLAPADPAAAPQPEGAILSEREVEVLGRISLGDTNKEAARALGISPSTVRAHLENVFRKLGCTTRAAATLKAMTLGLLSPA